MPSLDRTRIPYRLTPNLISLPAIAKILSHTPQIIKKKTRHLIRVSDRETLLTTLLDLVKADVVKAIHCELQILAVIQHKLIEAFPSTTFKHFKSLVSDIPDQTEQ